MSAIFISHSSRDSAAAADLKDRLAAWGHASIFLDFDPEVGIPPGRDWERELYHQLRTCRAVLVLCSRHSMASHWCFAEITHAKSLGKHVFPLKIADCDVDPVLAGRQVLDLTGGLEQAYGRLERALEESLGEGFPWDSRRPPYPGLMAFQEADAGVFFGRGEEIRAGLESVERLRRYGAGRALMVLGASGSGKSSLVRAGLIPRLRRDDQRWFVLPAVRPLDRPWRELAVGFARAFDALGEARDWREVQRELERAAASSLPSPEPILALARDLRQASGQADAKVLLILDQSEELLAATDTQARCAALLQAALASPASPLMMIGTLRTDLLVDFQQHPASRDLEFDDLRLGPLSTDALLEIVEGPAQVAGVDLEDGLGEAILDEAETEDTLPLIAFALRELYERFGGDRKLTLGEYRDELGGLGGSVAQAAEAALASTSLSAAEEELFRDAMLSLARIDAEGRYRRRPVRRRDLPPEVHGRIDAFVEARLLIARGLADDRQIEVAHEALFRSWDRLRSWLDEDRELLLWRKRLDTARREWRRTGRHTGALLVGPALEEGRRWLDQRGGQLATEERQFLEASVRRGASLRARRGVAAGLAVTMLVLIAASFLWLWRRAEDQRARAEGIARVGVAGNLLASDPTRAAQVLLEVRDPEGTAFAADRMRGALSNRLAELELSGHSLPINVAAWSPDGGRLLTASKDQTARIWPVDSSGTYIELADHGDGVTAAVWSPDGERVLTVTAGGTIRVWPAAGGGPLLTLSSPTEVTATAFDPTGERLLAVARNGTVRVWRRGGGEALVLGGGEHVILRAAFVAAGDRVVTVAQDGRVVSWRSDRPGGEREILATGVTPGVAEFGPQGDRLLIAGEDGSTRIWRLDGSGEALEIEGSGKPLRRARFSPFGGRLVTLTEGGVARFWDLTAAAPPRVIEGLSGLIDDAVLAPRGDHVALTSASGEAWLWSPSGSPEALPGHQEILDAEFSARGDRLVTASGDGSARIWQLERPETSTVLRGHTEPLVTASFSPGGDRIATASLDRSARIWAVDSSRPPLIFEHDDPVYSVDWSSTGRHLLTVSDDGNARIWPADGEGDPLVLADSDGVDVAAYGPRGERVATTSFSNEVKIWSSTGGEPAILGSHDDAVVAVAFAPGGERLVTASLDQTARIWTLEGVGDGGGSDVVILEGHEGAVLKASFSPDGSRIVTASRDTTARVWNGDGAGESIVLRGHTNDVVAASFCPDGQRVVTGSNDFEVRIWRLEQPDDPLILRQHRERITSASFSADGRFVASASGDGTARVWRSHLGGEPLVLHGHDARVTAAAFSPDGATVVTASEDSTARLWLISATRLRREIASAVAACLDTEYRRDYLGESQKEAEQGFAACRGRSVDQSASGPPTGW